MTDAQATTHLYVSTYCQHGQHDNCRLECKICGAHCLCPCHPINDRELSERIQMLQRGGLPGDRPATY